MPVAVFHRPQTWLASILAGLALLAGNATTAQADVQVAPIVQGQGSIMSGTTAICSGTGAMESAVVSCGVRLFPGSFRVFDAVPGNVPTGHWRFVRWEGCDASPGGTSCLVRESRFTRTIRAVFDDVAGPTMTSALPQYSTSIDRGVNFTVAGNEPLASASCSVDGGPPAACAAVRQFAEGQHTVRAQGVDVNGNAGALSGNLASFQVVDTRLVSGPADFSAVRRPVFRYATVAGNDFECSIDGGPFSNCNFGSGVAEESFTVPSDLADGVHTFRVRALNVTTGNVDRVPVVRAWTIDTVAPESTITAGPSEGALIKALVATFEFRSTEPGIFECRLDGAPFAPCPSGKTYTDLPFGDRVFEVRAVDRAGNRDATPARRSWEIVAADDDDDGFDQRADCNDRDPRINPGRPEILDNDVDENCDGIKGVDLDRDNDGVRRPTDCNDANAAINPNRPEVLENGVDENCDGADGVNLDRDGDGVQRPADCNDGNPGIRPGANDVPNNAVDEDCQGGDLVQLERIVFSLVRDHSLYRRYAILLRLQAKAVPRGSTVTATCKAGRRKCTGRARRTFTKRNAFGTVSLSRYTGVRLKPGTTITVTVTRANAVGAVKILKIRRGKSKPPVVTERCLPPGADRPSAC